MLTIATRHKYYKKALAIVNKSPIGKCGVCLILDDLFDNDVWHKLSEMFPEWFNKKPATAKILWWPETQKGKESRIDALKACIKETAPKKPTSKNSHKVKQLA